MMHYCPYCGQACYCDCDDTYFGELIPDDSCPHAKCEFDELFGSDEDIQGYDDNDYNDKESEE